jgi:hypothetical protein
VWESQWFFEKCDAAFFLLLYENLSVHKMLASMTEVLSRMVVAVESVLLLAPLSYFALAALVIFSPGALATEPSSSALYIAIFAVSIVCLGCVWLLVIRFVLGGSLGLRRSPAWLWCGALFGGALSIIGCGSFIAGHLCQCFPEDGVIFGVLYLMWFVTPGIVATLPLSHLLIERKRDTLAN